MKIGVIGGGVVGQATAKSFVEHVEDIRVFDIIKERRTHSLPMTLECDLIFVCLPTPQSSVGNDCDVSAVDKFFSDHKGYLKNFVLRSTVPVGTTHRLREQFSLPHLIYSPEFLTARCSASDAQLPSRNIIGDPASIVEKFDAGAWRNVVGVLHGLYRERFPGIPVLLMSSDEAEFVKNGQNTLFAITVAMWNELRTFADKIGLDWSRVQEGILSDGRIALSHCRVPGPDGMRGFGGACLPKDLASFIAQNEKLDLVPALARAAQERNRKDRAR